MPYQKPADDYDFSKNSDYKRIIENSGLEDPQLERLIRECHYQIDYVMRDPDEVQVPIYPNHEFETEHTITLKTKTKQFNNIEEVIDFIIEKSNSNYFFLSSFKDLTLRYSLLSFEYKVNGLSDDIKDRIREWKINQVC